jgi:hypothetical protein
MKELHDPGGREKKENGSRDPHVDFRLANVSKIGQRVGVGTTGRMEYKLTSR